MPQLSLYLDEPTMEMLRKKSAGAHQSMSKYVTRLIQQSEQPRCWPEGYWDQVYGCLDDPTFEVPREVEVPLDEIALFQ